MEYRLRHLPPAVWRIVRDRAGDRLDEGLQRLIALWAEGRVDPLAEGDPVATARGAAGGRAAAAHMSDDQRRVRARTAAAARWRDHRPASDRSGPG